MSHRLEFGHKQLLFIDEHLACFSMLGPVSHPEKDMGSASAVLYVLSFILLDLKTGSELIFLIVSFICRAPIGLFYVTFSKIFI